MAQCLGLKPAQSIIFALGIFDIPCLGKGPQVTRLAAQKTTATYRIFDLWQFDLEPVPPTMAASLPHSGCPGDCSRAGKTESSFLAGDRHDLMIFDSLYFTLAGIREVPMLRKSKAGTWVEESVV